MSRVKYILLPFTVAVRIYFFSRRTAFNHHINTYIFGFNIYYLWCSRAVKKN